MTDTISGPAVDDFTARIGEESPNLWPMFRTMILIAISVFAIGFIGAAFTAVRQPYFAITRTNDSLASKLDEYYYPGVDPRSFTPLQRRKIDLQTITIAKACGLPVNVDGIDMAYGLALRRATDTSRHSINVTMLIGDKVDMRFHADHLWGGAQIRCTLVPRPRHAGPVI